MKEAVKDKWIAALLSGEYKQTQGSLKDEGGFCCLGVLCDLAAKEGVGVWKINHGFFDSKPYWSFEGEGETLPFKVMSWAGMVSCDGELPEHEPHPTRTKNTFSALTRANDLGKTFEDIAYAIEGVWEDL